MTRILAALDRQGVEYHGDGNQYLAIGLCHNGDGPGYALSITYRPEDQATFVHCHAHGCSVDTICASLKMPVSDLYDVRLGEEAPSEREPKRRMRDFLMTRSDLRNIPPPVSLIDGWLFKDSLVWIAGAPKAGKSFVAIDMAASMAEGVPWSGIPTEKGKQLYVVAEGLNGISSRMDAWETKTGACIKDDDFHVLGYAPQLLSDSDVDELVDIVFEVQPTAIWLDTQARMTVGAQENDAIDMGKVIHAADRLRRVCGSAVVLVHHIVKANDASKVRMRDIRGSGAMAGAADTMIGVHQDDQGAVHAYVIVHKEAENPQPMEYSLTKAGKSAYLTPTNTVAIVDRVDQAVDKHADAVAKKIAELDSLGLPDDCSERQARNAGVNGTAIVLRKAVAERKAR